MNPITEYLYQFHDELEPKEFYRMIFQEGELDKKEQRQKGSIQASSLK